MRKEKTILELLHILKNILDDSEEIVYGDNDVIKYVDMLFAGLCGLITSLLIRNILTKKECVKLMEYLISKHFGNETPKSNEYWFPSSKLEPRQDFINNLIKNY